MMSSPDGTFLAAVADGLNNSVELDPGLEFAIREGTVQVVEAGFADVVRPYQPGPGVYTYWDYTQLRFPRRQGMRIDFALGSPAFTARVQGAQIDREERKGKGASDHAPAWVVLR